MIKNVSIISSKGLNPYSATWSSGETKQEVKTVVNENVQESKPVQQSADTVQLSTNPVSANSDTMTKAAMAVAGAAVAISGVGVAVSRKSAKAATKAANNATAEIQKLVEEIKKNSSEVTSLKEGAKDSGKKIGAAIAAALGLAVGGAAGTAVAGRSDNPADEFDQETIDAIQNVGKGINDRFNELNGKAEFAISKSLTGANASDGRTQEMKMHSGNYHGLNLLTFCDEDKVVNPTKNALAYEDIRNTAEYYVNRTAQAAMADVKQFRSDFSKYLSPNTIWSVTAEFEPMKKGGLGVVPKELQDNFTKLGLDNPTFIPMYLSPGKGELKQTFNPARPNDYTYYYKNIPFPVTKFATMPIKKYSGTIPQTQNIEFFVGYIGDKEQKEGKLRPIVFVNDNETFSTDLYNNGMQGHEKIKFAVLDKAVYQLAKQKISEAVNQVDGGGKVFNTGCPDIVINDETAYNSIKPPISMVLNDWHAAGLAGLMRYKAPLENAHDEISDTASVIMKKMPLLMIGHNAGEPGSTQENDPLTENVINTLYDGYAYGITENAASGYYKRMEGNEELNRRLLETDNYGNSVFFDRNLKSRQFNNLAHGVALSDWFVPVSKNYSRELMTGEQGSGTAAGLIEMRARAGQAQSSAETLKNSTVLGIVNGLDASANNIQAKAQFIHNLTGQDVTLYNPSDSVETIKEARAKNKELLGKEFILKELLADDNIRKNSLINGNDKDKAAKIEQLDKEMAEKEAKFNKEFNSEVPIISFAHRLTHQKGLEILTGAVKKLYNNWDTEFEGKARPFIIMGGPLDDTKQKQFLDQMKDQNNFTGTAKEDSWKIITKAANMPNPLIYAGSTYFCGPSTFEPCGLIQGEAFAMGTPVIVTHTGGYVDTVVDPADTEKINQGLKPNGFVADYDSIEKVSKENNGADNIHGIWLEKAVDNYYNKMVQALHFYYDKPGEYDQMVKDNLNINFSWSQGKSDDSIHQYLDRLGISDDELGVYKKQQEAKIAEEKLKAQKAQEANK